MNIDFDNFAKYSKGGPRYTSYPTAVEFKNCDEKIYIEKLRHSPKEIDLSLYVHLPFCRSACYFCGCNVIYTSKEDKKGRYLEYFQKELSLLKKYIDTSRIVKQVHFGGGTPTFFNANELKEVIQSLYATFSNISKDAEISCEIDPRYFSKEQMSVLKEGMFNRLSFGVQDFDSKVQTAIHRIQSVELVANAVKLAREFGIDSINFDLIYGLPYQDEVSFSDTLKKVVELGPDRLAIFNYAHVPWVKKTMRKIDEKTLPSPSQKLKILESSIRYLSQNGYEMIGMDHFAKSKDSLAIAKHNGTLRRNFQGYTTGGFTQSVGIGLTSISEGVDFYMQNTKDLNEYEKMLDDGILPTIKGIVLSDEDILRKEIIMNLMNNLKLEFKIIEDRFNIDFKARFGTELKSLEMYVDAKLIEINDKGIYTTDTGGMLIRNIAMAFDPYLIGKKENTFSKTV